MYDPYTDDREMEIPRRNVVLQPSGHTADTDQRKDEYQEQQLEAVESLDSQTQPDHPVYEWVEDIEPQVDVSTGAEDEKATAPDPQNLVTETDGQNKHKHTHWMHRIHLGLHRRSHADAPDRSDGSSDRKRAQGTPGLHDGKTARDGPEKDPPQSISMCHVGEEKDQTEKPNFFANIRRRCSELRQEMHH